MPAPEKSVYLDVSALCRPFDDQSQLRIRLETDAVLLILDHVRAGRIALITSPVHAVELRAITEAEEREQLLLLLRLTGTPGQFDRVSARQRAESLVRSGLGPADAAHLAFAEAAGTDFVSCDDRLLKQCQRVQARVWHGSPLLYCDKENLR